jgi:hypothetical protein
MSRSKFLLNKKTKQMKTKRKLEVVIYGDELVIYEWSDLDPSHPDCYEETPVHLTLEEAVETIEMEGFGKNLSKFIVELTGYSWIDKEYLDTVVKFMRENFKESDISWEETLHYLEGLK